MTKHGMERPDTRSETIQLLRMRYFLTERVYYHHTKVAAGAMISKAVELAHDHGAVGEDELLELTDGRLFERLRRTPAPAAPDPRIVRLVERLEARALLKRGYVVSALTVMKEAAALVRTPRGLVRLNEVVEPASEINALEARYAALWRLYVFVPETLAGRTAAAMQEMLGYPSEHQTTSPQTQ